MNCCGAMLLSESGGPQSTYLQQETELELGNI